MLFRWYFDDHSIRSDELPGKFDQPFLLPPFHRPRLDFLPRPELGVDDERVLVLRGTAFSLIFSPPPQNGFVLNLNDGDRRNDLAFFISANL